MSNSPASPELPDLDHLEALARGLSDIRDQIMQDRVVSVVDVEDLIDRLALARRAQPEVQPPVGAGHFQRDTTGRWREVPRQCAGQNGVVILYHGLGAQPEGEAPQAGPILADLWIAEGMARDAAAAIVTMPRKELKSAYLESVEELLAWKRRALEAEAKTVAPAAQHADTGAQAGVKPWEERIAEWRAANSIGVVPEKKMMRAEIAELRAALAAQSQGAQAAELTEAEIYDLAARSSIGIGSDDMDWAARLDFARAVERKARAAIAAKAEAPAALDWPHAPGLDGAQDAPPNPAQQAAAPGALNAARYLAWRDALVADDKSFIQRMEAALPAEVGVKRRPTAAEWDAAIDAAAPGAPGTPEAPTPATGVLCIGVAAPKGATVSVIQRKADGTSIVLHAGTHPVGDSMCTLNLASFASFAKSTAAYDVLVERWRQVEAEGYDIENDDAHVLGELGAYAAFYAMPPAARDWPAEETGYGATWGEAIVPADWTPPKPGDRRRELVKAGALVLAEIERMDRADQGIQ